MQDFFYVLSMESIAYDDDQYLVSDTVRSDLTKYVNNHGIPLRSWKRSFTIQIPKKKIENSWV